MRKKEKPRVTTQQKQQFGGNLAVASDAAVCMTLAAAHRPQTISSRIKPSKFHYKIKYFKTVYSCDLALGCFQQLSLISPAAFGVR